MLDAFLSRAGNWGISLHMSASTYWDPFFQPFIDSVMNRIVQPHFGRLGYLGLHPAEVMLPTLKFPPSGMTHAPQLESMLLAFSPNAYVPQGWEDRITFFDHASYLRRVEMISQQEPWIYNFTKFGIFNYPHTGFIRHLRSIA